MININENTIPTVCVGEYVKSIAKEHNIVYAKTFADEWANTVTKLTGDDVESDDIEWRTLQGEQTLKIQ